MSKISISTNTALQMKCRSTQIWQVTTIEYCAFGRSALINEQQTWTVNMTISGELMASLKMAPPEPFVSIKFTHWFLLCKNKLLLTWFLKRWTAVNRDMASIFSTNTELHSTYELKTGLLNSSNFDIFLLNMLFFFLKSIENSRNSL